MKGKSSISVRFGIAKLPATIETVKSFKIPLINSTSALVENSRDLHEKVAELNLPPALRGQVPTSYSGSISEGKRRMSNDERVQEALRRAGADGRFGLRTLTKALTELEASADAEHVIARAMEAGLLIQPRPGEWELVKG